MKEKYICEICGQAFVREDFLTETSDGKFVCDDCIHDEYFYCESCDTWHPWADKHEVDRGYWNSAVSICSECIEKDRYYRCAECGYYFDSRYVDATETVDGDLICDRCKCDHYVICNSCGGVIREGCAEYDEDGEEYYCSECWNKRSVIRSYGYKPAPKFKTAHDHFATDESIKELLLGVENEIDEGWDPLDTAGAICRASEDVYIKHDGSLGDEGMEIVSHPCTLEYHIANLGWDKICKVALESKYRSHDARTCGLHVHVGRRQLGETVEERNNTVAKIVILMDRHWDFMVRFSRRRNSQLTEWANRPKLDMETSCYTEKSLISAALATETCGRYMAVNLTNYDTIEFRLFNGTLKYETILATLQLVSNICEYAKYYPLSRILNSRWQDIVGFARYVELDRYIKGRGLQEMENPAPTRLNAEAERSESRFMPGDIVTVINCEGDSIFDAHRMFGMLAKVIAVEDDNFGPNVHVQFSKRISYATYERNGYEHSYMLYPHNLLLKYRPVMN